MAMKVIVFDVEHGACSFVRTPTNHVMLIDCGCTEGFSPALYITQHELDSAVLLEWSQTHEDDSHSPPR